MAFWRGMTRDQFVVKKVQGIDLLVVGKGASSNLVRPLKGESPFGADLPDPPPGARFDRMPSGLAPVSPEKIAFIQKWIDDGCLVDPFVPSAVVATLRGDQAPDRVLRYGSREADSDQRLINFYQTLRRIGTPLA
jgi:hypothetical protein